VDDAVELAVGRFVGVGAIVSVGATVWVGSSFSGVGVDDACAGTLCAEVAQAAKFNRRITPNKTK
jgi:hypothetical protein